MAEVLDWSTLPGRLVVLSGASGSGKSTLVRRLLGRAELRLAASVSATTRPPRVGEVDGRDYYFLSPEQFEAARGDLLESAEVHGFSYGTPAEPVRRRLAEGSCVILVIDVQGGMQVREKVPGALLVFVQVPDPGELERRLRDRGTDDEPTILRRLANARREQELSRSYDVHIVNDDLERCVEELAGVLARARCGGGEA
ncbi:Guanylate kinase [Aquisphaera giovannonii]|uniref:Guanylate kinase n=1 Tax=Aquisphaera giovannonii TaxID=406548 RepID=A0A5B9WCZ7_9BACT|nr:guanylate kinase [Aquisphaera giovannonii]QEH38363.1 Guanylate kinase [Aquisphaera giovannonii]